MLNEDVVKAALLVKHARDREKSEENLTHYWRQAWQVLEPGRPLKWGWHMDAIAEHLQACADGDIRRLIINIPPRHSKSTGVSVVYPTWMWTKVPSHQFLSLSHAEKLAVRDAVKSRRILGSAWYQARWSQMFEFSGDQNTKSRYENNQNGHRIAQGFEAGLTGEGGDTILIDDPHDAEKAQSEAERENVLSQLDHGIPTRLNDQSTGCIILIMQRLHEADATGHLLKDGDYEHLKIPLEWERRRRVSTWSGASIRDPRTTKDEILEPERFPRPRVDELKKRLGSYGTAGQLQQRPSPEGGGILKRTWWQAWPRSRPFPKATFVIQSYDTAFSEEAFESNSYSARTTWAAFFNEQAQTTHLMLVEAWRDRLEYPDLKKKAIKDYQSWDPDLVLVEKKASGQSLIQDLKRARIPIKRYNPDRDKVARAYAAQTLLENGFVHYPDRAWVEPVIHECELFPNGEFADWVDTCTQAWLFFMKGPAITLPGEGFDEDRPRKRRFRAYGNLRDAA